MSYEFDAFLSHRGEDKAWVRALRQNLVKYGVRVFLDEVDIEPGSSWVQRLQEGLRNSKAGILVCTAAALESNWVRKEMDWMIKESLSGDFKFFPVLLDPEIPDLPFLETIQCTDFSRKEIYHESFGGLLCALKNRTWDPGFEYDLTIPNYRRYENADSSSQEENHWIQNFLANFATNNCVVLLSQDDRIGTFQRKLLNEAIEAKFGEGKIINFVAPIHPKTSNTAEALEEYFGILGSKFSPDTNCSSGNDLSRILQAELEDGQELLINVTGFENGFAAAREDFCMVIRSLCENQKYANLKVLISGSDKLNDLYFAGTLSFLNNADCFWVPEMGPNEAGRLLQQINQDIEIDDVQNLLQWSGSHPRLFLRSTTAIPRDRDGVHEAFVMDSYLNRVVLGIEKSDPSGDFQMYVENADVGPFRYNETDPVIRKLFWSNLVRRKPDTRRLTWRSELIRQAAIEILGF